MVINTTLFNNLIRHRLLRKRMMWPANLPDLNPIEYLRDRQKRYVYRQFKEYCTQADLAQLLQEKWIAISQQQVSRLLNMRRCLEVIQKRGGYTHYEIIDETLLLLRNLNKVILVNFEIEYFSIQWRTGG
ncbi:Hypothetical predicted protein [Paramuricea clavata]|uniref:Uncharacterized protein n=1 Tax=Paramuricea clavata TaxID=317549 RepID=A0A7D9E1Z4_PARCT|nr:Hypothetical predicted protein [Paramuricea clavata]